MAARPVQISIDAELLKRVDADAEARQHGRSAFVRSAIERYLAAKERAEIERRIARAYRGAADAMLQEVSGIIDAQQWPDE